MHQFYMTYLSTYSTALYPIYLHLLTPYLSSYSHTLHTLKQRRVSRKALTSSHACTALTLCPAACSLRRSSFSSSDNICVSPMTSPITCSIRACLAVCIAEVASCMSVLCLRKSVDGHCETADAVAVAPGDVRAWESGE